MKVRNASALFRDSLHVVDMGRGQTLFKMTSAVGLDACHQ